MWGGDNTEVNQTGSNPEPEKEAIDITGTLHEICISKYRVNPCEGTDHAVFSKV